VAREPIIEDFNRLLQQHRYMRAALKMAVLLPLILITGALFLRWRRSVYAPMIYAIGIALAARVVMVMHEEFPARFFKYILIIVALLIVVRILVYFVAAVSRGV
jgi:hypothetical protein